MEYFTEQASSYEEAVKKIHDVHGSNVKIFSTKRVERRSLFRRKRRVLYEVSAYALPEETVSNSGSQQPDGSSIRSECSPEYLSVLNDLRSILVLNEFPPEYIDNMLNRLRHECKRDGSVDRYRAESRLLSWISDSIQVNSQDHLAIPHIYGILGPTGVGKTTTIAKIAALHGLKKREAGRHRRVRMVTIDSYRIGAQTQIQIFGDIMSIPVDGVQKPEELDQYLKEHQDTDIILIDTIGKSPKDTAIHEEMKSILSVCSSYQSVEFSLAVSASMKTSDIKRTIERFSEFPITSLILTKLDETEMIGNIIGLLEQVDLPVIYVTTGQRVPQDLVPMSAGLFLRRLKGFSVDLENLIIGEDPLNTGLSLEEKEFLAQHQDNI